MPSVSPLLRRSDPYVYAIAAVVCAAALVLYLQQRTIADQREQTAVVLHEIAEQTAHAVVATLRATLEGPVFDTLTAVNHPQIRDSRLDLLLPEYRAGVDRLFREALATQGDWNFECRILRRDGEVRWLVAAGGHQTDDMGRMRRISGIVRDITEAKRLDQVLQDKNIELERARAVAEKANLAKSTFGFVWLSSICVEQSLVVSSI